MERLADVLGRERLLLELLLFKVVELCQLLASDDSRFVGWASEEVLRATAKLREIEVCRALCATRLANDLGLPPDVTLGVFAECAPAPYSGIFAEQRDSLLELTAEIDEALDLARRRAGTATSGPAARVARPGRRVRHLALCSGSPPEALRLVHARAGYAGALGAAAQARLPSLVDFLS